LGTRFGSCGNSWISTITSFSFGFFDAFRFLPGSGSDDEDEEEDDDEEDEDEEDEEDDEEVSVEALV